MKKVDTIVREVCLLVGFAAVVGGLWMIYPPSALIVGGAALVWVGMPPREKGGDEN